MSRRRPLSPSKGHAYESASRGRLATLLMNGWLPHRAAAEALQLSLDEFHDRVRAGLIRKVGLGRGLTLYQVIKE